MRSTNRLVDSLPPDKRVKPMKVLALGLSRTGTMSLKVALERLGYKVYHMAEAVPRWEDKHLLLWEEALEAKTMGIGEPYTYDDLEKILQDYDVLEDIPCLVFTNELLDMYPTAKVILTIRDADSWEKSLRNTVLAIPEWKITSFMAKIDPILWRPYQAVLRMSSRVWTKGAPDNSETLKESFKNHYKHVRSRVPKSRLLEFQSKDGWDPLCKFLGVPVPQGEPYPRVNEAKWTLQLHRYIVVMRLWHITRWYVGAAFFVIIAAVAAKGRLVI